MVEVEQILNRCGVRTRTLFTKKWRPFRKVLKDLSRKWRLLSNDDRDKCANALAVDETDIS